MAPPLPQLRQALEAAGIKPHSKAKAKAKGLAIKDAAAAPKPIGDGTAAPIEGKESMHEFCIRETKQHQEKISRWCGDAGAAVQDDVFIPIVVRIATVARGPLTHFFRWLMKTDTDAFCIDGQLRQPNKLAQMVWHKAKDILLELEALTFTTSPEWSDIIDPQPLDRCGLVVDTIREITLLHHADFSRRVIGQTTKLPLTLLLLAKRRATLVCEERRRVASERLGTADCKLHNFGFEIQGIIQTSA